MRRKLNDNKRKAATKRSPPKAKVARSNRAESTTLTLPKADQLVEIPQGLEVIEQVVWHDFVPKRVRFLRVSDPILFDLYLIGRRVEESSRSA